MKRGRDESSSRFNHQMPSYDDERMDEDYGGSMPMYGIAKDWDRDALPVVEQQSFSSGTSRTGKRDSRQQHYKGRDHSAGSADRDYNHGSTGRVYNHGNADHDYYHDSADHGYNHNSADRGYNHDIDTDRDYYHGNADRDYHSAANDRDYYNSGIDRDYNSGIDRDYEVDRHYGSNNNSTNTDRDYHSSNGGQQRRRRSRSRSRDETLRGDGSSRGNGALGYLLLLLWVTNRVI
jgi:hypothetical protein